MKAGLSESCYTSGEGCTDSQFYIDGGHWDWRDHPEHWYVFGDLTVDELPMDAFEVQEVDNGSWIEQWGDYVPDLAPDYEHRRLTGIDPITTMYRVFTDDDPDRPAGVKALSVGADIATVAVPIAKVGLAVGTAAKAVRAARAVSAAESASAAVKAGIRPLSRNALRVVQGAQKLMPRT